MGTTGAQATTDVDFPANGTFIPALDLVSVTQQKRIYMYTLIVYAEVWNGGGVVVYLMWHCVSLC